MSSTTINGARGPDPSPRGFLSPSHQGGAFSVYRKPQIPGTATIYEPSSIPSSTVANQAQLEHEVSDLKNENQMLSRVSTQLLDQLSVLQARRNSVAYKINQLRGSPT